MSNPNNTGVVICPSCEKEVPDTLLCLYCGDRLKGNIVVPPLKDKERQILEEMLSLGDVSTVSDIHNNIDGSKEYIRMVLVDLTRFGLVDKPSRGRYVISKLGKSALIIQKDIKIEKPIERPATILIEKPKILRAGTMIRIFKRAGGTRMGKDGFITLASVLEKVGDEIAHDAVVIANENNRTTVRMEDMEQAIGMLRFRSPEKVE